MPTTTQIKKKTVPAPNSAKTVKSAKPTKPPRRA